MKTIIINRTQFTEITYTYRNEREPQAGILIHDLDDINDGDLILGNGAELPTNEAEAADILDDSAATSAFTLSDGIYRID